MRASGRHGAALAAALLTAGAGVVLTQGRVLLHECVTTGSWGRLGIDLLVLRDRADCPAGTLGLGQAPSGVVVLLSVALPVLALHLALVAGGLGLGTMLLRAARAAAALVRAALVRPAPADRPLPVARRPRPPLPAPRVRLDRWLVHVRPHRGPPLPA
ncbi:hypothetical protein [Cellulomonas sp. NTE-D12]|uniref:hypothetical protein n=1 Tax=Cellulomonas sp. NTE-D12 TaxID=2962632 RepID=UPI003081AE20|nr:hypothetical protein CELD12_28880 [Cellulomonas sp. NTE-D12]